MLILQQAIGSSTHLVAQHVLHQLLPTTALLWRGMFAATGSLAWLLWRNRLGTLVRSMGTQEALLVLLLGAFAVPLNQWCFFAGVQLTTAANASLFYALTPVWALLLSRILRREALSAQKTFGITAALLGVGLVLAEKDFAFSPEHVLGNVLLLSASLAWAGFTVLSQLLPRHYDALSTTALSMLTGWLLYLPVWIALGAPLQLEQLHPTLWAELLYMGVITSGVGYLLWLIPLHRMVPSRVAIFSTLQPLLTTLAAVPLFGFVPSISFLAGGGLILIGIALTQLG
ncbi:MAG: DMT family transporter [Bacteroidota bacterium]|nr:DMT family transporter [Bacteroidota bacterium]